MSEEMKSKNLIELGYEPESDYCGGCDKWEYSRYGDDNRICIQFGRVKLGKTTFDVINGKKFKRCQQCKSSEQAAKQMIPREEIEKVIEYLDEFEFKTEHEDNHGLLFESFITGITAGISKLRKLLKETE